MGDTSYNSECGKSCYVKTHIILLCGIARGSETELGRIVAAQSGVRQHTPRPGGRVVMPVINSRFEEAKILRLTPPEREPKSICYNCWFKFRTGDALHYVRQDYKSSCKANAGFARESHRGGRCLHWGGRAGARGSSFGGIHGRA